MTLKTRYQSVAPDLSQFREQMLHQASSLANASWAGLSGETRTSLRPQQRPPDLGYAQEFQDQLEGSMADSLSFGSSGADSMDGFASNVPRSLIQTESGGNFQARNNETGHGGAKGHYGIVQFGDARLADAKRAGVIPANMTPDQFLQDKEAQIKATNWHFSDIDNRIRKNGLDKYVGQTVGGVPMSWDGMRAMAHLGGFGGLSKFINSGGEYNPADSFGTSLSAYGKRHKN